MIVGRPSSRNLKSLSNFLTPFQFHHFSQSHAAAFHAEAPSALKLAHFHDADNPFDDCSQRDISYYNSSLFELSRSGLNHEAINVYTFVNRIGVSVDGCSMSCVLKVSACLYNHVLGRQLHCHCVKNGLFEDVSVGASLVDMYIKNENLDDGKRVFDEITDRNVLTWTSLLTGYAKKGMIEKVMEVFRAMKVEGIEPNPYTYAAVIGALADEGTELAGASVHSMVIKIGLDSTREVGNSLVSLYYKSGLISEASEVFDSTEFKDAVSWNGMISGLVTNGFKSDALEMLYKMRLAGVKFTQMTYAVVVKLGAHLRELCFARCIHCQIIKTGFEYFDNIRTGLVVCYMKCGEMDASIKMFTASDTAQSVVSWTAAIGGYLQNGRTVEAIEMFLQMRRVHVRPNHYTYSTIVAALQALALFQVHADVIKTNYENSPSVGTALLNAYIKLGKIKEAEKVFKQIEEKDIVAWSAMLVGYAQEEDTVGTVKLFSQLTREGVTPNEFTFSGIINACAASSAATDQGKQLHASSIKFGCNNALMVSSALVTMYAKKGDIEAANEVFKRQKERDLVSWNSMIAGYAQHGYGEKALNVFHEMRRRNLEMDEITFIGVISACTHAGLVKEGELYFEMMVTSLHISPTMEIYSCMVDLYGRAGMLGKAMALIDQMPFPAGATVWRTLLSASRVHQNIELGKVAAEKLISCQPQDSAAYVLLANLYAAFFHSWRCFTSLVGTDLYEARGIKQSFEGRRISARYQLRTP